MHPFRLPSRRAVSRLAPALVMAFAATGLVAAASAAPAAAATSSPLRLVAPTTTQTIQRWPGESIYLYDLGLYEVADKNFEIRTRHTPFNKPVVATWSVGEGASKVTKTLPSGLMTYADHIPDFYTLKIKNSAGTAVVNNEPAEFCPNSYAAARAIPTGASSNPYPYQCGQFPFAIGGLFGIPRGWSVKALGDYSGNTTFDGPDGLYTLTLTIAPAWRKALGISAADATSTITLDVQTEDDGGFGASPAATKQAAGSHTHGSSAAGVLSPQGVKLQAARLAALGKAGTPAAAPPRAAAAGTGSATARASSSAAVAAAANGPRPDLRSAPAFSIQLDSNDENGNPTDRTYLQFGANVWNAGPSPLVVDGFRRPGTGLMDAYQYFYDSKGKEVGSANAGTLEWDPRTGHHHWHFTAFATYQLLDSTKTLAVRSGKESFCLAPTDAVDLTVKNVQTRPYSTDLTTACGSESALSIREVLDVGWGDTYGQYLPGQSFDVTDLANGTYYVQVLANPDKKLAESDTTNNSSLRKVKLGGTPGGQRTIYVYPYQGVTA